jgi:hypothetical protein
MTAYNLVPANTLTKSVKERKEKRRKVIEAARKLERESYLAFLRKKRPQRTVSQTRTAGLPGKFPKGL